MEGTTVAAVGSLAGFVASIVLFNLVPSTGPSWDSPGSWVSVALLLVGLVCFVVLLITGLITVLNWIGDRSSRDGKQG